MRNLNKQRRRRDGTTSACAENACHRRMVSTNFRNYLRVRGECTQAPPPRSAGAELPPRARRMHPQSSGWGFSYGTTSACAENAWSRHSFKPSAWNYLRVRGECGATGVHTIAHQELPPRARRMLTDFFSMMAGAGTTSACAENATCLRPLRTTKPNYLRVRGECLLEGFPAPHALELPPRARRMRINNM